MTTSLCISQTTDNDKGKGVPSFDEMMDIALVDVDFDDPTTNVRKTTLLAKSDMRLPILTDMGVIIPDPNTMKSNDMAS